MKSLLIVAIFISVLNSCANNRKVTRNSSEGVSKLHSLNFFYDSLFTVNDYAYKLWHSDSSVIFQFVGVDFDFLPDSNSEKAVLITWKYIYLDLKNLKCQDYLTFDTSAKATANYKLAPEEFIQNNLFLPLPLPFMKEPMHDMNDTVIENKKYKRIRFDQTEAETHWRTIVYLSDKYSQDLFHLNVLLDKKYSPMRVMRIDWVLNGELQMFSYYEELNNKLTKNEKAIFKRWKLNADTTTLPVITFMDALKTKPSSEKN
ncbi:MAG: hypothetical protein ABIP68_08055 [Ferruginibacter sp.]